MRRPVRVEILAPMASAKTQPTATSLDDFLAGVSDPARRADGERVARVMADATGAPPVVWGTAIVGFGSYDTPTGPWPAVAFAPRKQHTVLYLGDLDAHGAVLERLGRHKLGKGCLYLPSVDAVDHAALAELISAAYAARTT